MLLEHSDRQDEHRPLAIERVDLGESQFFELENSGSAWLGVRDEAESADDEQAAERLPHDRPPIRRAQGVAGQYRPAVDSRRLDRLRDRNAEEAATMPYMTSLVTRSLRASRALWRRIILGASST